MHPVVFAVGNIMVSRMSYWSEEQKKIQAKYDAQLSRDAVEHLLGRINSLESIGKLSKKQSTEIQKSLSSILKKIEKAAK